MRRESRKALGERTAALAKIPTEAAQRLYNVMARAFHGINHVEDWDRREPWGAGVAVVVHQELATFDFTYLTRLVVAAHDECVRVSIISSTRHGGTRIGLHPRSGHEGDIWYRHDSLEVAVEKARRQ